MIVPAISTVLRIAAKNGATDQNGVQRSSYPARSAFHAEYVHQLTASTTGPTVSAISRVRRR
jgi:hypothetical protein